MSECERRGKSSIEYVCLREHVCVSDHINHFSAAAARSPIYLKISLLKSPSDIIWLFTEFSGLSGSMCVWIAATVDGIKYKYTQLN